MLKVSTVGQLEGQQFFRIIQTGSGQLQGIQCRHACSSSKLCSASKEKHAAMPGT
jgi:hypothetical protein